jgi:hypothetical protein
MGAMGNAVCKGALVAALLGLVTARAATPFDTPGPFVQYSLDNTLAGSVTVFGSQAVDVNGASGAAGSAHVVGRGDVGVAKIGLEGSGTFNATAWAGWNDSITVNAGAALAGTSGRLTFALDYSWTAQVNGTSSATAAFVDVNLIGAPRNQYAVVNEDIVQSCSRAGQCGDLWAFAQNAPEPSFANGVATFSFNVVFGQAYTLVIGMNAAVAGQGSIGVDATHSLYWGGVTAVTNASGQAVPFQITATSGANYAAPIPEAPTWALWGAGLLLMLGRAARRR